MNIPCIFTNCFLSHFMQIKLHCFTGYMLHILSFLKIYLFIICL
ncbi:hypothetical protein BMB171_C1824 [Bacillus thuringiensis BMB171]|nr:hypothetical protein BMB171_C1824 [Bacillus thuringiensis BMB171]